MPLRVPILSEQANLSKYILAIAHVNILTYHVITSAGIVVHNHNTYDVTLISGSTSTVMLSSFQKRILSSQFTSGNGREDTRGLLQNTVSHMYSLRDCIMYTTASLINTYV